MLELQRASAGSGKTFALAKKFIWYYITIPDEEGRRRLRRGAELNDSLSHILAVTFTNKATNEMQQRIVEKLYALGYPDKSDRRPDYMEDFMEDLASNGFPATEEDLSAVCRRAVGVLLNNYSDFHVSTIDSFFQQVLRTFAYESDLSDSYRIELDTNYLSTLAIDALLEDINSGRDRSGAAFWIEEMMRRAKGDGKKWNVFAKSKAGDNPYSLLTESVKRLENEEFKQIRRQLDDYFAGDVDLTRLYTDMQSRYEEPVRKAYADLRKTITLTRREIDRYASALDAKDLKIFSRRLATAGKAKWHTLPKDSKKCDVEVMPQDFPNTYHTRKKKGDTAAYQAVEDADLMMAEVYERWAGKLLSKEFRHWWLYRENLPFMGMLQAIREKRDQYLRENNAIELGETNAMLHDIIGEDDAPFIYERIGTRLNHFLIDEFQDTSRMQWKNISPLLHESIGRGNENLIIGDAKQSIYRFRNADSSLISERVPEEFGVSGGSGGESGRNTNWRSDLRVVQFNNSFFHFLTHELNRTVGAEALETRRDFLRDYRNVVQHPNRKKERGYVEVRTGPKTETAWGDFVLWQTIDIIRDALVRGFRMRDIAVLVDSNKEGEDLIAYITEYNAQLPPEAPHLEYVSEESLRLGSSAAVSLVVAVLETISRGADPKVRTGEERIKKGVADWGEMACNYRFFAMRHPELATPDCLEKFFAEGSDNDAIREMLSKMQAVTLIPLVESIIAEFVPADVRRTDAVFLAAFQDMVLEYCEGHPSDIASFLKWWEEKKDKASISSPEGMDAVTVMTIHKSKGLEFPLVIVPFVNFSFSDGSRHTEWRWVRPEVISSGEGELPPYLPVATSAGLERTTHEEMLYEYYDMRKMDALNSIYVAFTRAACELYIFSKPAGKGDTMSMSSLLEAFYSSVLISNRSATKVEAVDPGAFISMEEGVYSYGKKCDPYESKEDRDDAGESVIEDYTVRPTPDFLMYKREDVPEVIDAEEGELSDDRDPRSEGNLMHEIMQQVKRQDDILRAVRRMEISGRLSHTEAIEYAAKLTLKTGREEVKGWFDGSRRVINERPLLKAGRPLKRPDRIMVSDEGDATVVDYKFGESMATHKKYARQVYDYVETLKTTGLFRSVKGYLWYVNLDKVELVAM